MLANFFQTLRNNLPIAISCILFVMFLGIVSYWFNAGNFDQLDYSTTNPDDITKAIDVTLLKNSADFGTWYKANTLIQCGTIFTGVSATVLAALSTQNNSVTIKTLTVLLTAITTILVTSQSIFHIRENLDTFIKVNTDLDNLKTDYLVQKESLGGKDDKSSLDKYIATVKKKLAIAKEARLRAYAIIGPQQTTTGAPPPPPSPDQGKDSEAGDKPK